MKKRFMAALSVLALALALPVAAFAAPSPANPTATGANNVTASVNNANVKVVSTTKNAEGTPAGANVVASFEITETVEGTVSESNPLTVTFTLGKAYAKVTVYVQHNDGSKETLNLTADNNGNVTFKVTKLSTYTIVAEKTAAGAATTDNGAKSPATGVNTTAVAAVAAVAAAGAACAFVALRKNN